MFLLIVGRCGRADYASGPNRLRVAGVVLLAVGVVLLVIKSFGERARELLKLR